MAGDYPPFAQRTADGTYAGFDVDMANTLAATIDVPMDIVPTT